MHYMTAIQILMYTTDMDLHTGFLFVKCYTIDYYKGTQINFK